jgi:hypothetical protein
VTAGPGITGVADLTEDELHALQLLAEKRAGASVAFINIGAARSLSDRGLASRSQEGWDITPEGGAELARRAAPPA